MEAGHQSLFHTSPSRGWITVALVLVRFDPCRLHPLNRDAGEAAKRQLKGRPTATHGGTGRVEAEAKIHLGIDDCP